MVVGAPPKLSFTGVLVPVLLLAIFGIFGIVFADTLDDFVTVSYLSGAAESQTLSMTIYPQVRGAPTPAVNAAATFMLVSTTLVIALGYLAYRRFSHGQADAGVSGFTSQV